MKEYIVLLDVPDPLPAFVRINAERWQIARDLRFLVEEKVIAIFDVSKIIFFAQLKYVESSPI